MKTVFTFTTTPICDIYTQNIQASIEEIPLTSPTRRGLTSQPPPAIPIRTPEWLDFFSQINEAQEGAEDDDDWEEDDEEKWEDEDDDDENFVDEDDWSLEEGDFEEDEEDDEAWDAEEEDNEN